MRVIGNWLNKEEKKTFLDKIRNSEEFKAVISRIRKLTDFKEDEFETSYELKFDVDAGDGVTSAKSMVIKYSETIEVSALYRIETSSFVVDGNAIIGDSKIAYNYSNGEIEEHKILVSDLSKAEQLDQVTLKDEMEALPINPDYYEGILDHMVEVQNPFYSGCLRGGYIWCGVDCGGSIACTSSTVGINYLDSICKTHDCCYHKRGVKYKNCYCDSRLCSQSSLATNGAAKTIVRGAMCSSC